MILLQLLLILGCNCWRKLWTTNIRILLDYHALMMMILLLNRVVTISFLKYLFDFFGILISAKSLIYSLRWRFDFRLFSHFTPLILSHLTTLQLLLKPPLLTFRGDTETIKIGGSLISTRRRLNLPCWPRCCWWCIVVDSLWRQTCSLREYILRWNQRGHQT